jgi:hypothetical protein
MLVKRAFETNGIVEVCEYVKNASNKYRKTQDHIALFVTERVVKTGNMTDKIKKIDLTGQFNKWFSEEQGNNRKPPKVSELVEFMNKKFGLCKSNVWYGLKLIIPEINELEEMEDDNY